MSASAKKEKDSKQSDRRLSAVLVGCGGMGKNQAKILAQHPDFRLLAVCDVAAAAAAAVAAELGVKAYADVAALLAAEQPATVIICTGNDTHAALTIAAAQAGVKGVYCEKPMATNLGDARAMVAACAQHGTALVINHQRRVNADLVAARELIVAGALGELMLVRGNCAGDILSDGTHLIDSLQWLTGDQEIQWVFGQVQRDLAGLREKSEKMARKAEPGMRYGHVVESGGLGVYQLASGVRVEIFCGDLIPERRYYQDYEIFGTQGRLWRLGDQLAPNLFIEDAQGGPLRIAVGESNWFWQPLPCAAGQPGSWRAVDIVDQPRKNAIAVGYELFAKMIRTGAPHPMRGEIALRGFEAIMAIYESARLHRKITLPLQQERFPFANLALNGLDGPAHRQVQADAREWLPQARLRGERFDLVFCDPPTFSNSKRMEGVFDVQRDHATLIDDCLGVLAPGGLLVFSTNAQKFALDGAIGTRAVVKDISRATLPADFARNPRIHQCFEIRAMAGST